LKNLESGQVVVDSKTGKEEIVKESGYKLADKHYYVMGRALGRIFGILGADNYLYS
jgi:hypothetical protein